MARSQTRITKPTHANRRNARNEVLRIKELLASACRRLDEYGIALPDRVGEWWTAQKALQRVRKVRSSEFGMLQTLIAEEEAKDAERDNDTR